ncbi:hypothetical protein [Paenibacillus sp. 1P03SA]|uniref:hypothetical protein n=1 Tax=Paenibacillus sp. 1P03SA TaxID=3132294 RepID=UPI0039A0F8C8
MGRPKPVCFLRPAFVRPHRSGLFPLIRFMQSIPDFEKLAFAFWRLIFYHEN